MTPGLRMVAGALALILGAFAVDKLLDLAGYAAALGSLPLVESDAAWEAALLYAVLEACAAGLLALVAAFGRHARVALQGGAALALAASLGYAILIVSEFYAEHPLEAGALLGTRVAPLLPVPALVVLVVLLLSGSAWLLMSAFLLPNEPVRRRRRRRPAPATASVRPAG